jgi:hypothetical protein
MLDVSHQIPKKEIGKIYTEKARGFLFWKKYFEVYDVLKLEA